MALLTRILAHIDFLEESLAQLQGEMEPYLTPFEEAMELVQSVVGIGQTAAANIIAEIGADMTRFASDKHIASWAGVCPGNHESAGKRKSGQPTKGNKSLRTVLVEAAWAATHAKGTFLQAKYQRLVKRMPKQKALGAVAHRLLVISYHLLSRRVPYAELGSDYGNRQHLERQRRRLVERLEELGVTVTIEKVVEAA